MITFYKTQDCPACGDIEEILNDMVLAHQTITIENSADLQQKTGKDVKPPLLIDGDEHFQGITAIIDHLEQVAEFKKIWEKYQSDACYCDENQ